MNPLPFLLFLRTLRRRREFWKERRKKILI
jgi:hypothetical protein